MVDVLTRHKVWQPGKDIRDGLRHLGKNRSEPLLAVVVSKPLQRRNSFFQLVLWELIINRRFGRTLKRRSLTRVGFESSSTNLGCGRKRQAKSHRKD